MSGEITIDSGYARIQLARALRTLEQHADPEVRARAVERVRRWEQVIAGLRGAALTIGSRTPAAGVPAWVTLEVVHGGFATGGLSAGGEAKPHELELEARLGVQGRAALNCYYLSDPGQAELAALSASGCYRVEVPEEGALLVMTWLLGQGRVEAAHALLDQIFPFFDRLRFYPRPDARPLAAGAVVKLEPASVTRERLERRVTPPRIAAMNESLTVWGPLTDRLVALFFQTVRGDRPTMDAGGVVAGGWPCAEYPPDWRDRATALLVEARELRRRHAASTKPQDAKGNLARLLVYLEQVVRDPASLRGRDVGAIRRICAAHVRKHGAPGSAALAEHRAAQAAMASRPTHKALARVLAQRLAAAPADAGIGSLAEVTAPVEAGEARAGVPAGATFPPSLQGKLGRCLEAPVEELVAQGVVGSSEVLASLLPQWTAQVDAAAFASAELRTLYAAIYAAFRRRRSLLLLDLESQVRIGELPWVAALQPFRAAGVDARVRAGRVLEQVATLAITAFPQTILPNKLIVELRALAKAADLKLPLVSEIAADIFTGEFTPTFTEAAQLAARQLGGTLYARYYELPIARVRALDPRGSGFAALCEEQARLGPATRHSVARSGAILEQTQILTTHNLAALFDAFALERRLAGELPALAERCFRWICQRERDRPRERRAAMQQVKNSAYALRQMIYLLSRAEPQALATFVVWAREHMASQPDAFQRRFAPVLRGLQQVVAGAEFDAGGLVRGEQAQGRRLLGWSVGGHWLLA